MGRAAQFFQITQLPNYKQTLWNTRSSYEFYLFHFAMLNILPFIKPPKGWTVRIEESLAVPRASSISQLLDSLFLLKLVSFM